MYKYARNASSTELCLKKGSTSVIILKPWSCSFWASARLIFASCLFHPKKRTVTSRFLIVCLCCNKCNSLQKKIFIARLSCVWLYNMYMGERFLLFKWYLNSCVSKSIVGKCRFAHTGPFIEAFHSLLSLALYLQNPLNLFFAVFLLDSFHS